MAEMIRAATYIHATYDAVWKALTRPDQHEGWFVAPCLAFGWEPGERVAWGTVGETRFEGEMVAWQPATAFAYTFAFTQLDEPAGRVEWSVLPLGEVVWVEVKHLFEEEAMDSQALLTDGWVIVLARLKTLLETGQPMPWPEWEDEAEA